MSDWIEEKAAQIKKQRAQAEEEQQLRIHEADVIHAKGRDMLEKLEAVVRMDVEKWNSYFPNDAQETIESVAKLTPNGFSINKTGHPTALLRAVYDPDSSSIQFAVSKVREIREEEINIEGFFHLNLSQKGDLYLTDRAGDVFSLEDASRHLLEEVLGT